MVDLILSDGREVTFDFKKVTHKEHRSLFDNEQSAENESTVIGKSCGFTAEEIDNLSQEDWRRLILCYFKTSAKPLDEQIKNSPSASI